MEGCAAGGGRPGGEDAIPSLLRRAGEGDRAAEDALFRAVYDELRDQARAQMSRQPRHHTLTATALVHEVYLKLGRSDVDWVGRTHFFATAARAMRQVLVDHARGKGRQKRGAGAEHEPLDEVLVAYEDRAHDVLVLDEALTDLERFDPQAARVVEMRFFGGLTNEEIAERIGVSSRTVGRDWESARAWLAGRLAK